MPYGTYAECPCCRKVAKGEQEIEEKFGYRNMENGDCIPQSYCRACRSAGCKSGYPCRVKRD